MQIVSEGGVATFTATASGIKTVGFKYKWRKLHGEQQSSIVGRNRRHLMINNVRIKDADWYYCIVTNEWDNKKPSQAVQLLINGKMIIYTQS